MNAPTGGRPASADARAVPALADFIVLNEEIAALVRARIPLEPHLARLGAELPGKSGDLAQRIGKRMEAGETLIEAMDAECASLPPTYRAAIIAGVESGRLGSALESLVESASRMDRLRRVTGLAVLYPLIIFVAACLLFTVTIMLVVPNFEWLDEFTFKPIAWLARSSLTAPVLAIALPCLAMVTAAVWWWRSGRLGGTGARRLGLFASIIGGPGVVRWSEAATFAEMCLLLVERGVPIDRSLRLAAESTADRRLRGAAQRLADDIQSGGAPPSPNDRAVANVLSEFPILIRLALRHTNDRALLAGSLRQAAGMYHERAARATEWYSEYLPILLTVLVGGTITAGFTLFVLWPYASALYELSDWNWR
jgi:general secretion pathway protein F